MADNTGPYVGLGKFLTELANAGKATASAISLTNKVTTVAPAARFDFSPSTPAPAVGDWIVSGSKYAQIISLPAGNQIELDDATTIPTGVYKLIKTTFTTLELQDFILEAMAFIDRHTRQWFNARTFDDSNPITLEGNNSETLFLPVPILTIASIKKQKDDQALDPTFYRVYNGRELPDDRRNPMIKLRQEDDDVLFVSSGKWMRGVHAVITGTFGFLEPDGSTPRMIQRATLKLALMYATRTLGESAAASSSSASLGPIKREKTDFHEIEYFDARTSKTGPNDGSGLSGDDEVDDTIAAYKGPILIGGSFPDIGIEAPIIASWTRD